MRFILFCFLILIFFTSCSIEKRLYGRGYHVTWHKRYSKTKGNEKEKKLEPVETAEEESVDSLEVVPENPAADSLQLSKEEKKKARKEKYPDLPREERKFEPLGVLAFKILLINIPIGLIGENATDPRVVAQMEIIFLFILIIAFVLAIISMVRYLRNPKHYKFNIFAILVILIGLFYLVEFILGNYVLAPFKVYANLFF